ncbi:outer membrane protein assembly factor BamD [Pseudoduganella sp. SL102]|uniref:Outer membrane protein assembly factor BamD n=1 Tax=Pseudoduganella albidiflava TaxID=321983 RepID=A0ABX5RTH4_9BURK|nr:MULTISPECIES: outer membrane protein assembly factor BamD [Pseudoduganella]QBI01900.1 outer membrane protein assembly factor BamD [Pseudoduganella albidiflava]WBR99840.1 outer membrane protein assembly factor BamD [Pseudoduganella sp. SL102]
MQKKLKVVAASVVFASLSACSLLPEQSDETKGWSASKLYSEAKEELAGQHYERAIQLFNRLEASYPFGVYAQQAQLEVAYAYYKAQDQAQALAAVERFIKLHPNHPNVDYMYYLRGLINFNDQIGLLNFVYEQDPAERDPKATREAFAAFKALVDKFPESKYTPDAIDRMKYLINAMAAYEVYVARYYYRRGAYLAAANRAMDAVREYADSPAIEEALWIMVRSYDKLGNVALRDDAMRVFKLNFPSSKFLDEGAPKPERKWWKFWSAS